MSREEDMSNTFVSEVGQKSAIFKNDEKIESLDNSNESTFPEVRIDPPSELPSALEDKKEEIKKEVKNTELLEEDEEFLEANKKKKRKKYKKRNPFVMFLIMVICLALGAGASYYYFEIYTEKDVKEEKIDPKVEEESKVEEIKPTSLFINELIKNYDHSMISSIEIYPKLYSQNKVAVKDLDETYLRTLVAKMANRNLGNASFTSEDFQNSVTKLFGNQVTLEDKTISADGGCTKVEFKDSYYNTTIGECGGTSTYAVVRKIVKAVKTDKNLEVNVAVAVTDGNKIYKKYNATTNVGEEELTDVVYASFDIEKDYTKFNQYKYTFNYDNENNNYYLTTIELVK